MLPVFAQKTYTLKGIVVDTSTQEPVPFVTLALENNVSLVKSGSTKENGTFLMEKLSLKKYVLTLIAVGYQQEQLSIDLTDSTKYGAHLSDSITQMIDLGKIRVAGKVNQLKEVRISAERPLIKQEVDKISYNVQADPANKGENMLDMMRKVPMISLDGEDNIQLKGNTNYKILINGRPSSLMSDSPRDVLRGIPASSILKIEVITSPSAKYDSEGLGGIINIVTVKRINDGYKGYLGSYYNSLFSKGAFGGATIKINKLAASGNLNRYFHHKLGSTSNSYRIGSYPVQSRVAQDAINNRINNSGGMKRGSLELSYEIDSLNLITGSLALTSLRRRQSSNQNFEIFDQNSNLNQSYLLSKNERSKMAGDEVALNYQLGFKKDKEKILTASYNFNKSLNDRSNENFTHDGFNISDDELRQQNEYGSKEQTAQLDYIQKIKKISIEGGLKLINRNFDSDFLSGSYNSLSGELKSGSNILNLFDYIQTIYALYNSYELKLKSWGLKGGIRLERTSIDANFVTLDTELNRSYNNLIPSVNAQRKLSGVRSINFGYTQRIQRPGIGQLNPFENRLSPLYYTSGNPELLPVRNHSFEFSFRQFKKGSFITSLDYSFANNAIQNIVTLGNDSISRSSFKNIGKIQNLGLNVNVNYPATKNFNITLNGRLSHISLYGKFNGKSYENGGLQGNVNTALSYMLKNEWKVSTNMWGNLPSITLQGRSNANYSLSFNVNKNLFQKKVSVMAAIRNPFQKYNYTINKMNTSDFIDYSKTQNYFRHVYINFFYNFGSLKSDIKKNKRGVKNDDIEKERIE
jgi:outer membrane receptor protein involved in Fe transport